LLSNLVLQSDFKVMQVEIVLDRATQHRLRWTDFFHSFTEWNQLSYKQKQADTIRESGGKRIEIIVAWAVCWSLYVPYVHLLTLNSSILQTFREVDTGFILNFMFQSSVNVVVKLERWFDPSAALWAQWSVHAAFFKILVTTCTIKFEQVRILRVCDLGRTHLVSCENELVKEIWLSALVGDILYWMGLIHC
jgi:hypothetical protein